MQSMCALKSIKKSIINFFPLLFQVEEQQNANGEMITKIVNEFSFCNSLWFVLGKMKRTSINKVKVIILNDISQFLC